MPNPSDWEWREEIAKYLPQIGIMSFAESKPTIKWLFNRVKLLPEVTEEAEMMRLLPGLIPFDGNPNEKWQHEIEKYIPQIRYMSFVEPKSTIRWIFSLVEINEKDRNLAKN